MAKLGAYYGLCPLIDHRSLLGISQDEENGVVVVTLGRNIAIKFKLSDQKQLHSWRTKEKFSSPIIYDKQESQYISVFNESFIRLWSGNEEFLDKLRKIKFQQQIQTIFVCNDRSFIVFKNGVIRPLKEAMGKRKHLIPERVIDLDSEFICEVLYSSLNEYLYVGLIVQSHEQSFLYWTRFNELNEQEKFCKISLQRENADLKGYLLHVKGGAVNFLSLWSDGRLYSCELIETDLNSSQIGELFTVVESISCKEYVSMTVLDQNYIAMYGCNSNEEGALLVIYNVQFKIVQSRQSFKLFTNGAKLWCIDKSLLFPVGQNLAVVPFHLDMEQIAALVGSHKVVESDPDPDVSIIQKAQFVSWGKKRNEDKAPKVVQPKIQDFITQGLSENMTFETLLTDLLEQKNVPALKANILYFSDITESALVKVLKLILNLDPKLFKKNTHSAMKTFPQRLLPMERTELLDIIFTKPFNETLLLPHLRSVLSLDEALVLLQYVYFLMSEEGHCLPAHNVFETEAKLIEWSCIILDSNYQKFLLSKDDQINDILVALRDLVKEELGCSEEMLKVVSLLHEIKKGKSIQKTMHTSLDYNIEEFHLY